MAGCACALGCCFSCPHCVYFVPFPSFRSPAVFTAERVLMTKFSPQWISASTMVSVAETLFCTISFSIRAAVSFFC